MRNTCQQSVVKASLHHIRISCIRMVVQHTPHSENQSGRRAGFCIGAIVWKMIRSGESFFMSCTPHRAGNVHLCLLN